MLATLLVPAARAQTAAGENEHIWRGTWAASAGPRTFHGRWWAQLLEKTNNAASGSDRLAQIPFQIEVSGAYTNIVRWLFGLSLRGDELRASGFGQGSAEKAPLFIDRLIIKKQSADKPDDVHVFLRVIGFVMRDSNQALD